jgi:hypothetical protein
MQSRALVKDSLMPDGVDWFVTRSGGCRRLYVRESKCVQDCDACPILAEVMALSDAGEIPGGPAVRGVVVPAVEVA